MMCLSSKMTKNGTTMGTPMSTTCASGVTMCWCSVTTIMGMMSGNATTLMNTMGGCASPSDIAT